MILHNLVRINYLLIKNKGTNMSKFSTPNFSVDLSGQVALVTGASSGLGYRFSKVLAGCGAR